MQQTNKINRSEPLVDGEAREDTDFYRKGLVAVFGSKKGKRLAKSRQDNQVKAENVTGGTTIANALRKKVEAEAERTYDGEKDGMVFLWFMKRCFAMVIVMCSCYERAITSVQHPRDRTGRGIWTWEKYVLLFSFQLWPYLRVK